MNTCNLLKRAIVAWLSITFLNCCFAIETNSLISNLKAGKKQTIVTYGTSVTAGGAWVGQIQQILDKKFPGQATIVNSAKGGMWSKWGLDNLKERILKQNPDAVIIEFAINDAFINYNTSPRKCRKNLEKMIDRIQKARPDCQIILMTMNPPIGENLARRPKITEYYEVYREVARKRKLLLIDHYPNWMKILQNDEARFKSLIPDGIHPNAAGSATVITPQILRSLGLE